MHSNRPVADVRADTVMGRMRFLAASVAVSVILVGCSTTIPVRADESLNNDRVFNYNQVNARIEGTVVTLHFAGSDPFNADGVWVASDSTAFCELESGIRHSIATRDLLTIQWKDHISGALTGGLLGSLAGLGASLVIILSHGGQSGDGGPDAYWPVIEMTGVGGLAGACVGAFGGSTQEFQFRVRQPGFPLSPDSTGMSGPK
jgi:hypothetical protein